MKKTIKAYIEAELRDYHQTKKDLEETRDNLLNLSPGPPDGMPRGGETSDPTFQRAARLMTNRRIKYMEMVIGGISLVLDELPPERLELVRLKYWTRPQTLTDAGIALKIGCGRATLYRWTEEICIDIGTELGVVDELREKMRQY